ncbi:uncharacterized protein Z520_02384 [Fonsecaea multimorphosa CBS 102226]|uniref:Methyltransferase domain-containing protein n=1 Tax=Fonsecaea multimorphosa CBS 102226 TaxID=1442371 RepID=A0A0D2HK12_9EURO|nr:uncharacterized protein Z520_02384 [Fonsecaea multimorphosa CBS 102226]KIY02246.1 hypothetical protein Z520_02384 [Fonsecaea multimorphosa CBS 102226]OAL28894.1 hypothetical protein AYO22_02330 [Fonsecaea multimorphosa]
MSSSQTQARQPDVVIEAEEVDSALGDDLSTYTLSLRSSLLQGVQENGRVYHKYKDGSYILPEDSLERERLDIQHEIFLATFGRKLFLAPVQRPMQEVIDLGTGTGIWAIEFADQHPESNVLGIDLSPIQPRAIPPNCKFDVDDFDTRWTFNRRFDFIHGRMLLASCSDFPRLFRRALDALQPGGWLEMQDLYMPILCDDGTLNGTAYGEWNDRYIEACVGLGRDPSWTAKYKDWMVEAGFTGVRQKIFRWPVNPWPKDKTLKEIGIWNMINMQDGLDGFTIRLWTTAFGMTAEEIRIFLVQVRKDLRDTRIHSYWPM